MTQMPQTDGVKSALTAAERFEQQHYETGPDGLAKELEAGDFKAAMNAAGEYVSEAAQKTKDAVVGKTDTVSTEVADASDSAHHAQPATDGKTWMQSVQDAGAAVANKLIPAAHAMQTSGPPPREPDGKSRGLLEDLGHKVEQSFEALAHGRAPHDPAPTPVGEKWGQAKSDAKEGGQKLADAASEAADAATTKVQRAGDKAAGKADEIGDQAKGSYHEAKDVTMGAKDRVVEDTKSASGSAADSVNQGAADAKQGGENVFQNIVDGVKKVADRFTAPVSGDEDTDKAALHKVTGTADQAHDTARDKAEEAKGHAKASWNDAKGQAQATIDDAKDKFKSNFSDETRAKAEQTKNEASKAAEDATDSFRGAAADAKASVESAAHDVKASAEKKVEEVEDYLTADMTPHTVEEAAKQTGHIPSNTADVTRAAAGPGAGSAPVRETEAAQGMNISADRIAAAADQGYGEENLGADDMVDVREAVEGAGLNAKYH